MPYMTSPLSLAQRSSTRNPIQTPAPVATLHRQDTQLASQSKDGEPFADQSGNAVLGLAWATALSVPLWVGIGLLFRAVLGGI